ncbi:MAG: GNAT family N-acetyltransferase [Defluviitaleaceae bacterium]|nr:GNAT family N-acetyltransferase [Defluviitaleaceae bacterium]
MEIRRITPEERIQYDAICQICFLDIRRRDIREELRNPPEEQKPDYGGRKGAPVFAAFENGKMLSALTVNPYVIRMNGHEVKMGGIGAVVTLPEARGRGLIKKINTPVFEAMREEGQVYSFLYPFSFEYYRKFGYEHCYARRNARIPIEQFEKFPYPKQFVPHEPDDGCEPYARIYETFTRGRNLAVVRDEGNWKWMLNRDPYMKSQFTYLNYGADGTPNAYLLYEAEKNSLDDGGNAIKIRELCWTSPEGLYAAFGFFGKMGSEYRAVKWSVPYGLNIQAILPDPYDVEWRINAAGMNRIVDVPAALAMQSVPAGSGRVHIKVNDDFWPANSGTYRLEWENGNLTATCVQVADIDMETHVTTLAQLTTGYIDASEARYRSDTVIRGDINALNALFPKKYLYLLEGF